MSSKRTRKKNKQQRRGRRIWWYILLMVTIVCVYLCCQYKYAWDWLTETVATVIAIVAAVAFWLEYYENKLLNEAQFIMDLNDQFISNENLSNIEWELEKFYNKSRKNELTDEYIHKFEEKFDEENSDRQHLVNYLVHLEGIAALVNNGVLHLEIIDDLMSYRYFVAVNNPIVQELELLEYPDFYKGCFAIYEDWVKALNEQSVDVPMKENNLIDTYENKAAERKTEGHMYCTNCGSKLGSGANFCSK